MPEKAMTDKQTIIWAMCSEMVSEGIKVSAVTGRKVAARLGRWSHTTVTPYVTSWHTKRIEKEQEMIAQTQMSESFVKALLHEVDSKVSKIRASDEEKMSLLSRELDEAVATASGMEKQIEHLCGQLENSRCLLTKANSELDAANLSIENKQEQQAQQLTMHNETVHKLTVEHSKAILELKGEHESKIHELNVQQEKYREENEENLKQRSIEHTYAVEKMNTRLEEKNIDLTEMTSRCIKAELKAEEFDKVSEQLSAYVLKNHDLMSLNLRLTAELDAMRETVSELKSSLEDARNQRDRAQQFVFSKAELSSDKEALTLPVSA